MAEDTYYKRVFKRGAVKLSFLVTCAIIGGLMEYIHIIHWLAIVIVFLTYVCAAEWLVCKLGLPKIYKTPDYFANTSTKVHEGACSSPTCIKYDPSFAKPKPKDDIL